MKKYFIADVLTALKLVPAVCILIMTIGKGISTNSGVIFFLFGVGELLDAFDGMAAKKWPHPPETEKLWFRRHIKLLESGLDLFLAITVILYIILKINFIMGIVILAVTTGIGLVTEFLLYGRLFGTPKTAKKFSLFYLDPEVARAMVGFRLMLYLACMVLIIVILLLHAPWSCIQKLITICLCLVISFGILIKKLRDGRLDDVLKFLKKERCQ